MTTLAASIELADLHTRVLERVKLNRERDERDEELMRDAMLDAQLEARMNAVYRDCEQCGARVFETDNLFECPESDCPIQCEGAGE